MVLLSHLFYYYFKLYVIYISLAKYIAEREYVSPCFVSFSDNLCSGSSFAQISKAPNPLLFNSYLRRCVVSFERSTITTLFTKPRHRATCNFASEQINKFICNFSYRSEFLCWSSKLILFCLLSLTILLWPPDSLAWSALLRSAWEEASHAPSTPGFSSVTPWTYLQQSKLGNFFNRQNWVLVLLFCASWKCLCLGPGTRKLSGECSACAYYLSALCIFSFVTVFKCPIMKDASAFFHSRVFRILISVILAYIRNNLNAVTPNLLWCPWDQVWLTSIPSL